MSSRIIVKNLPKHITEERFREHFGSKGEITDAKLIYAEGGRFRKFGYIGFRSEEDANAAQSYYDGTFIDTSRIVVEIAKPFGDATLPRAWSVYTKGSTLYNKAHNIDEKLAQEREDAQNKEKQKSQRAIRNLYEELLVENQDDPRFKEFLQVMAPRANNRTWANDDYANWQTDELAAIQDAVSARREQVISKDTKKSKKSKSAKGKNKDNKKKSDDADMDLDNEESLREDADFAAAPDLSGLSDMEWLRMHMSSKPGNDDDENGADAEEAEQSTAAAGSGELESKPQSAATDKSSSADSKKDSKHSEPTDNIANTIEQIRETGRLFIRNLPYLATEDDLRSAFEKFGPLSEVHMPISRDTKRPKGFAYILYLLPEHAVKAYKSMDNKVFLGRLLHILPGKEKPQPREAEDTQSGFKSSVKKERDAKKKALAGSDFNWNSLYMSADAVADSISERLSISKADLLSADSSGNPAVRLALAETHIINDTKQFFEDQGVILDSFSGRERSDTVILVKNIPFSVDEDELRALFGKHGSLGRVLVPPSRTIAVVEFLEPSEARTAFRHLAYKRLKDAPIYLERAPKDIFSTEFDAEAEAERREKVKAAEQSKAEFSKMLEPVNDPATSHAAAQGSSGKGETGCVLFVKNLDFDTTEETLRSVFSGVDGLVSVVIRRKKDAKRPGKWLSMGFGFVEYNSAQAARQALQSFQGIEVDDHKLDIKLSDRVSKGGSNADNDDSAEIDKKKPKSTKLVIKNIPFEATRQDIRELVAAFGQIKSVRLPKKFSGGHRGFAFIEFLTPQEAQHVLDTMKSTHLYGRHLVIDWAEEENSLEAMREKVGRQFAKDSGEQPSASKRRKIEEDLEKGINDSDMNSGDDDDEDD
ncbi:Multiple RNA-binding domain-containing protein 1 [Coemansia sp. IMI 203386]|nr:Multiple RNA-binding domain-containing protein 1 [Coemansia sp. IMI 203386]